MAGCDPINVKMDTVSPMRYSGVALSGSGHMKNKDIHLKLIQLKVPLPRTELTGFHSTPVTLPDKNAGHVIVLHISKKDLRILTFTTWQLASPHVPPQNRQATWIPALMGHSGAWTQCPQDDESYRWPSWKLPLLHP